MWWGSLIAQGAQDTKDYLKFQQNKGVQPAQKWQTEVDLAMWERQRDENRYLRSTQIQTQAADARAAGLHPLFAMGKGGYTAAPSYSGGGGGGPGPATGFHSTRAMKFGPPKTTERERLENRLMEQQIESNDIELYAKSSEAMRLSQELTRSPVMARAYSEEAAKADRVKLLQRDLMDRLAVRTGKGGVIIGAYGGVWKVPPGVSPQESIEMLMGEAAELFGIGILTRMTQGKLTGSDKAKLETLRKRHNARVEKGQRARKQINKGFQSVPMPGDR